MEVFEKEGNLYTRTKDGKLMHVTLTPFTEDEEKFSYRKYEEGTALYKEIEKINWKVKDSIFVPIGGQLTEFVVEHIRPGEKEQRDKVYFVSKKTCGTASMKNMHVKLASMAESMPMLLVDRMALIEHSINPSFTSGNSGFPKRRVKISLLSLGNVDSSEKYSVMQNCCGCCGGDDIPFDGFREQVNRTKDMEYLLDTPVMYNPTEYCVVGRDGSTDGFGASPDKEKGIVVCFAICKNKN